MIYFRELVFTTQPVVGGNIWYNRAEESMETFEVVSFVKWSPQVVQKQT